MTEWWEALSTAQQIFLWIATFSSFFLVLQLLLTFIGFDADEVELDFDADTDVDFDAEVDADADADSDGDADTENKSFLRYFTVRNLIAFLTGFSWSGLVCLDLGLPLILTIPIASFVGLILVSIVMLIMYALSQAKSKGNVSLKNAIGHTGTVSIMIGRDLSSAGKVTVSFHGGLREVKAVTHGEELRRGDPIKVIGISDGNLVVEKQKTVKP